MMFYYIQKYIYDKAYIYYKALLSIPHIETIGSRSTRVVEKHVT